MTTRKLSTEELSRANALLTEIREKLSALSGGDPELLFAYRRKVTKELSYDERSKPTIRRKLKELKWKRQRGACALCGKELPEKYCVLDRLNPMAGYTEENTRLIHVDCDIQMMSEKRYT